ncbi:hypothetical protein ACLQ81_13740 [Bordetella avium]|uniref:hypothetical protein n=4 Tax=Bordetella avium TaxID=521 RepID=UPI000E69BC02|nr:hypothetical protein [Bordetella avium]RIQ12073.1 hypothetical protein D0432_14135 [Bordetella avium]RIQ77588.1 hypothetical protein D0835_14970 [Bordetella avium]RIQ83096.1 hypothetical protein D0837_14275 [Bordetella avium]
MTNQAWQPIATAPKNQLVMVYTPPQPSDWPDSVRIGFDYIDPEVADDYWYNHGEHYEHYCCVAKPENCTGPGERAPYTHWMPIPPAPGADTEASVQLSGHPGELDESLRFSAQRILDAAFHWAEQRQIGPAQAKSAWVGLERHVLMQLRSQRYDRASRPAATAVSAEPVAWMDPETKDVITQHRKFEWERFFGEGGKRKAESYTVELTYTAPPAEDERANVGDERAAFETWAGIEYRNADEYTNRDFRMGLAAWKARAALASAPVAGENGAQSTQNRPESRANTGYTGGSLAPVAGEVNAALDEWLDKTDFIQERIASGDLPVKYLGWHRADVMRDLIDGSKTEPLNAAPQASTAADARHTPAPDWMSCESRRPWVIDSLAHQAKKLRRKERGCRISFRKDYMGVPVRYLADAYGEAAAVFEARIAAIAAQQGKGGE